MPKVPKRSKHRELAEGCLTAASTLRALVRELETLQGAFFTAGRQIDELLSKVRVMLPSTIDDDDIPF